MSKEKVGAHILMVNISRTVHFLKFSELLLTMILDYFYFVDPHVTLSLGKLASSRG